MYSAIRSRRRSVARACPVRRVYLQRIKTRLGTCFSRSPSDKRVLRLSKVTLLVTKLQ